MGELWLAAAVLTALAGIPVTRQLRTHPQGMWVLFFTEMWERFSYYGMRSLLIFYLTEHFVLDDRAAQERYSAYVALNYLLPLAGGLLGDRILGARRAVAFGSLLLVLGHCMMAVDDVGLLTRVGSSQAVFNLSLALIVVGVGFQKSNMATLAGALYAGRSDRDQGFTLYMFGINIGAFWSTVLCGWLASRFGWWAGFGVAGLGMTLGYLVLMRFGAVLGQFGLPPVSSRSSSVKQRLAYASAIPAIALVWWLLQDFAMTGVLLSVATVGVAIYLAWMARYRCTPAERIGLSAALGFIVMSMAWAALAEQGGAPLSLFVDRNTSLSFAGTRIAATQIQAFYMGFVLMLVPMLAWLWRGLDQRGRDLTPMGKFAIGFCMQALGFALLASSSGLADAAGRIPLEIVVMALLLQAASEMTLAPAALSAITRLAPSALPSTLAAVYFVAMSWGYYLGGFIGRTVQAGGLSSVDALAAYLQLFSSTATGAAACVLLASLVAVALKKSLTGANQ